MPFTQNNPFPRKTSPLRVDPFAKKVKTISPGVVSIDNPEDDDISLNQKPIKLEGQPMPEKPYEELSDMEEAGVEQPNYEDPNRKPFDNTVQGRMSGPSRKSSPLNDSYIKQEEKMIKRNQERGNQYQQAASPSKNQRLFNAVGAAGAMGAIEKSKETINYLKST